MYQQCETEFSALAENEAFARALAAAFVTDMKKHLGLITEHIVHVPDMEIFHLNSTKELLYY